MVYRLSARQPSWSGYGNRRKEYGIQKRWEEVLTEFSYTSFSLVFTVNITKQDKTPSAIRRLQFKQID